MIHTPDVTVIIPTYNALQWLPAAIASVGPDPRVELLVVDDGSHDGTLAWLEAAAARDARLRFLEGGHSGPSGARNLAIAAAQAPLIAFLDADDRWAPDKLSAQLAFHAAHREVGFSFTDYRHVTVSGEDRGGCFAFWPRFARIVAGRSVPFVLENALAALLAENVVGTSTVVVRTDLLRAAGGFRIDLASAEDWDLWLTLSRQAPVGVLPAILADYLMHRPGNVSARLAQRLDAMSSIAARFAAAGLQQDPSIRHPIAARLYATRAEIAEAAGQRFRATALRVMAACHQPDRRAVRAVAAALLRRH